MNTSAAEPRGNARERRELGKVRQAYPALAGSAEFEPAMMRLASLRVQHRSAAARLRVIGIDEKTVPLVESCRRLAADCSRCEQSLREAVRELKAAAAPLDAALEFAEALAARRASQPAAAEKPQ